MTIDPEGKSGACGAAHTGGDAPVRPASAVTAAQPAALDLFDRLLADAAAGVDDDCALVSVPARRLSGGETSLQRRRGRGRPAGSHNLRNHERFQLLEAKGHRDPLETLSELQSFSVKELAGALRCELIQAAHLIRQAASDLAPYKYAKKQPPAEELPPQPVPVVNIGQLVVSSSHREGEAMDINGKPFAFQGVSIEGDVRRDDDASHE